MKKLYDFLQENAIVICIFFGVTPYMPSQIQQKFGGGTAAFFSWILLFAGIILFTPCFWWAKSSWTVRKPANMMALTFASVLGLMVSISALLVMYGVFGPELYLKWREVPAAILQGIIVCAALWQVFIQNSEKE